MRRCILCGFSEDTQGAGRPVPWFPGAGLDRLCIVCFGWFSNVEKTYEANPLEALEASQAHLESEALEVTLTIGTEKEARQAQPAIVTLEAKSTPIAQGTSSHYSETSKIEALEAFESEINRDARMARDTKGPIQGSQCENATGFPGGRAGPGTGEAIDSRRDS